MKLWQKIVIGIAFIFGLAVAQSVFAAPLLGFQGGTGQSTSSVSAQGDCLVQTSSTPFLTWGIQPCFSTSTPFTLTSPLTIGGTASTTIDGNGGVSSFGAGISVNSTSSLSALKSILNGEIDLASQTIIYANNTSTGDYGTYLTNLCNNSVAASGQGGATIIVPAENVTFSQTVLDQFHCAYVGAGPNATVWNWGGGQGATMAQINSSSSFSATGGGASFQNIHFKVPGGSESTTNPIVGITVGGNNGGSFGALLLNNLFGGTGVAIEDATGSVNTMIAFNTFEFNGRNWQVNTSAGSESGGSGEQSLFAFNWAADGRGGTSTVGGVTSGANDCILFQTGSVENAFMTDNVTDNCQVHVQSGNNVFINGDEVENSQSVGDGAFVPFAIDTSTSSQVSIANVQVMNDATSTGVYPAIFYVGSNVNIDGVVVNRNVGGSATTTPYLIENDSTDENLEFSNISNFNNGFAAFGNFTTSGIPTSTFRGSIYQYANQALSGQILATSTGQLTDYNVNGQSQWTTTSTGIFYNGRVGIGTNSPVSGLTLQSASETILQDGLSLALGNGNNASSSIGFEQISTGTYRGYVGYSTSTIGSDTGFEYVEGGGGKGIGLDVNGTTTPSLYLTSTGTVQIDSNVLEDASGNKYSTSSASVAGNSTYIQYNTGGNLDATSTFTFTSSTETLSVPNVSTTAITINGNPLLSITKKSVTGSASCSLNTACTIVTSTFPTVAGTTTVYQLMLNITGNNTNNQGTTTISLTPLGGSTTTIMTCGAASRIGNDTIGLTAYGVITLLNSTSSGAISWNVNADGSLCGNGGSLNTGGFSGINLSTTTLITVQHISTGNANPTNTGNLLTTAY